MKKGSMTFHDKEPVFPDPVFWGFGEGVDSARGVAAIVVFCRNSLCNSPWDAIVCSGPTTTALFWLFRVR